MTKIICKNCGWENDNNLSCCLKCGESLHSVDALGLNKSDILKTESLHVEKHLEPKTSLIWRCKSRLYLIAVISTVLVVLATISLYSFYGPLTPNGNRYYHSFNLLTVPLYLILLALGAMAILYYPVFKLYKSKSPNNFKIGIFPTSKSIIGKIVSVLLSILNIGSGLVFTVMFILITCIYVCAPSTSRVMADDLETLVLIVGYIGCMIFWGIVDLVYTLIFKHNW